MSNNIKELRLENSVPYDLVEEILLLLPVDSLIRFKSVNRFFCSLIESPTFASKQLHHRRRVHSFDHTLILLPGDKQNGIRSRSNILFLESARHEPLNWDNAAIESRPSTLNDRSLQIVDQDHRDGSICFYDRSLRIVDHCDGLICFSFKIKSKLALFLWNPILRRHKPLPMPEHPSSSLGSNYIGFGHDPKSRDYKIIRLVWGKIHTHAQVYSLRTDSWRPIPNIPKTLGNELNELNRCAHGQAGIFSGGLCYWVIRSKIEIKILLFDMSKEAFRLVGVPRIVSEEAKELTLGDGKLVVKPMVWNESVRVVMFRRNCWRKNVRIWELGRIDRSSSDPNYRVNVEKSYTLRLDRLVEGDYLYPELCWNDKMVSDLFRTYGVSCNVETDQTKFSSVDGNGEGGVKLLPRSLNFQVLGYIKSLVPLD